MSDAQRTRLIAEACDAVLHSRLPSHEADVACREVWRRWCSYRMPAACERVRQMTQSAADGGSSTSP
jgi:hypothetical protein